MDVRRVVAGRAADGLGRFVSDGRPPHGLKVESMPGLEMVYVWSTDDVSVVPNDGTETTRPDQEFYPPSSGSRFMVISYPPGYGVAEGNPTVRTDFESMAASAADQLMMHATVTVDYGVVLSGELCLVLDSGAELVLKTGDVVVQNGTSHGWRNRSETTTVAAFVIVGAHAGSDARA